MPSIVVLLTLNSMESYVKEIMIVRLLQNKIHAADNGHLEQG